MPVRTKPVSPPPVFLVSASGISFRFASLQALSQWLCSRVSRRRAAYRQWRLSIGPAHRVLDYRTILGHNVYRHYDYILTSASGKVLDPGLIPSPSWADHFRCRLSQPAHQYRAGPVPHTGKSGPWGNCLRNPKTVQARRVSFACPEDPPPRAARNSRNLPSDRDDIFRCHQRSWKKHRKTQWK